jgi:hypothetical protein
MRSHSYSICIFLAATTEAALGAVKGGEAGGRKLEKETVSAETLEFLKVRFAPIRHYLLITYASVDTNASVFGLTY